MVDYSLLTAFDYLIFVIIALSAIFAFFKGFIKSFLYFLGWIISLYIVLAFYPHTSKYLSDYIGSKLLINLASTVGLYIVLLLIITFINDKFIAFAKPIRGGLVDRSLGMAFGVVRGCIISCAIFWSMVVMLTAWDEKGEPEWLKKSQSYKLLNQGTTYIVSTISIEAEQNDLTKFLDKTGKFKVDNPQTIFEDNIGDATKTIKELKDKSSNVTKKNFKKLMNDDSDVQDEQDLSD